MKIFYAPNRRIWRDWLSKNYNKESEIWLVRYKKSTGKPCISYENSVEETLCFGWIDSIEKGIDIEWFVQHFTPRRPKSNWSPSNRERAKRLIEEGLMTPAGRKILPEDL